MYVRTPPPLQNSEDGPAILGGGRLAYSSGLQADFTSIKTRLFFITTSIFITSGHFNNVCVCVCVCKEETAQYHRCAHILDKAPGGESTRLGPLRSQSEFHFLFRPSLTPGFDNITET